MKTYTQFSEFVSLVIKYGHLNYHFKNLDKYYSFIILSSTPPEKLFDSNLAILWMWVPSQM